MADIPKGPAKFEFTEPDSAHNAKYPYNNAMQTECGHLQEFDDTSGAERIRTQHKAGTYTEIRPDGTEVHKIVGEGFDITVSNKKVSIGGFCTVTIAGDSSLEVKGNVFQRVKGDYNLVVEGDYNQTVIGKTSIKTGKNMDIGTVNPTSGKIKLLAGESFIIDSNLSVNGSIKGDSIHSFGSIVAETGIHAGVSNPRNVPGSELAGITTLGGINAGFPPPQATVPGVINASVLVTAPAVVGSVITFGSILMDPMGGPPLIRTFYDIHTHIAPNGITTTPTPLLPLP
jgi:hypothetical protein